MHLFIENVLKPPFINTWYQGGMQSQNSKTKNTGNINTDKKEPVKITGCLYKYQELYLLICFPAVLIDV